MEIFRYLTSPLSSPRLTTKESLTKTRLGDNNEIDAAGCEWVEVDEPCGIFMPRMKRRRQLLQLDQARHVLHYDSYRRFMRVHDIALITAVEEIDDDGRFQWWMSIQDASTVQVWIVHFSSLSRLESWVRLLRSVVAATNTRALISDLVLSNASCPPKNILVSTSPSAETILEMSPEEE